MKRKLVSIENSLHQMQEFVIEEYDEHIVLAVFLSRGIENVEIPEMIECNAFFSAGDFDLVIPDSVKEIGVGAFYWGPRPITSLPEDEGWYSHWPYGEKVVASELQGRITGFHYLEHQCMLYDITFDSDSEVKQYVYPCDYIDGNIRFLKDRNQKIVQKDIKKYWGTEEKIENAYKIMNAWKRGFIAPH